MLSRIFQRAQVPRNEDTLLDILAPDSAHLAVLWLENQSDDSYQAFAFVVSALCILFGTILVAGDWYTSVQGIRVPLADLGLIKREHVWQFPAFYWWSLPMSFTLAQVIPRKIPGGRLLYYPATVFNGATTGLFFALLVNTFLSKYGVVPDLFVVGFIASLCGLVITVAGEHLFLMGLMTLRCAVRWN